MPETPWEELLKANLKLTEDNHKMLRQIRRHLIGGQILAWVKFLLIFVPLVLAYFYLKPYYHDTVRFYREFLNGAALKGGVNLDFLKEFEGLIKNKK